VFIGILKLLHPFCRRLKKLKSFAYLTGLFINSYLLDAKILFQFAVAVVPALVAQTLLSFYYQMNDSIATLCIAGSGILLLGASKIILGRLDPRWKSTMFRIA